MAMLKPVFKQKSEGPEIQMRSVDFIQLNIQQLRVESFGVPSFVFSFLPSFFPSFPLSFSFFIFYLLLLNYHMWLNFTPTKMTIIKKIIISVGENVEKLEPSYLASGEVKWCMQCFEKQFDNSYKSSHKVTL